MARPTIHPSNLVYLVVCLVGVATFVLVAIYPNSLAMNRLDDNIAELNQEVQSQELLYPIYRELIKEVQQKVPTKLPLLDKTKIVRNDLGRINDLFLQLARQSKVAFESAAPDASSYLEESGYLTMNAVFSGDFFNLRALLISICQLPYLESIDQMQLDASDHNKKRIALKLKLIQE